MGEFEVFPTPGDLDDDLHNAFLIATGILLGFPKVFVVLVEEFTAAKRSGTKRQTRYSKNRSGMKDHRRALRGKSMQDRASNIGEGVF